VFFTDGLVERRGEAFDTGLDRLVVSAGRGSAQTLEDLADSLIADALGGELPTDDVALLLLRPGASRDDLYLELRTDAKELARLRRVAGEWLRAAGARDDEVGELVLALNELAANAVEHAYGPHDGHFTVQGARTGTTVSMAVTDAGRWRQRSRPSARGRGLVIARQLVDELEIDSTAEGTAVRFRRHLADGT
jgi:anti-sigma regulatory factor (Ser/Thr protein kinase)